MIPGLVHDLNNVFQTLVDVADLLAEDTKWKPLSAALLRSVERGRRLTESLQSMDGAGAESDQIVFDPIGFDQILDDAIAFVEDSVMAGRGPGIQFVRDVEPGIELAGHWAWERVLINLFLNAMRAMPQGGAIHVEARRRGDEICIAVRDTGSGIASEILERLFEPYVSTKPPGSTKQAGSTKLSRKAAGGLGLHVVHTIVSQNGGTVRGANRTNTLGAEFVITVPSPRQGRVAHA